MIDLIKGDIMYNLTGIYWIKDEARYIPEYIEFHLLQGFDHFIFYDNGSTDNLLEVISPYIEEGLVEIRNYPPEVTVRKNFWLMDTCIHEQRGKSKWVHYHALDERLFCPDGKNLVEFLKDYDQYGGVSVGWIFFNSNGHTKRPDGLIIENFTTAFNDGVCHIKTIIQPEKAISTVGNPHNFFFKETNAVDENFNVVVRPDNPDNYSFDKIKLHHYVTMSEEEFNIKSNKGILDHSIENTRRPDADVQWIACHDENNTYFTNTDLLKYVDIIRENILKRYEGKGHLLQYINH
jgi:hypothetical protein